MPKRCVFGCNPRTEQSNIIHVFPKMTSHPVEFEAWVKLAGGKLETPTDFEHWIKKVVCHRHFAEKDLNRNKRIKCTAIPSLHIPSLNDELPKVKDIVTEGVEIDKEVVTEVEIVQEWTKEVLEQDLPTRKVSEEQENTTHKELEQELTTEEDIDLFTKKIQAQQMLETELEPPNCVKSPRRVKKKRQKQMDPLLLDTVLKGEQTSMETKDKILMPLPLEEVKEEYHVDLNDNSHNDDVADTNPGPHTATIDDRVAAPSLTTDADLSSRMNEIRDLKSKALACRKRASELLNEAEEYDKRASKIAAHYYWNVIAKTH